MDYPEGEKIVSPYLKYAKKPNFNRFCVKKKDEIASQSVKLLVSNAITLMRHWIITYNRETSTTRPTVKLVKALKTASMLFFLKKNT